MAGHSSGTLVQRFCTQRKDTCQPCGNSYASVLDGSWADHFKHPQLVRRKTGTITVSASANAHHILCVAEVTKVMSRDAQLQQVLRQSVWCVNNLANMITLPLFAHTVHWYCTHTEEDGMKRRGTWKRIGEMFLWAEPPPFRDLPNHNYDHGIYNEEVERELADLKAEIKQADHDIQVNSLAARLNSLSDEFRNRLLQRGKRRGGTHAAWEAALHNEDPFWYQPFSLAATASVTSLTFPRGFGGELTKTLDRLRNALLNGAT